MDKYEQLEEIIKTSSHIVFFGGAGVSTESGIPDFRSADGLYNTKDVQFEGYAPEYLLSHDCLFNESKVFFEYYRQKLDTRNIKPNKAHSVLALMEKKGKLDGIITQNIDGLHQKAGSHKVWEIHGSTLNNYCSRCGKTYPSDYIFNTSGLPICGCGGLIRPDVTMYGEALPEDAWTQAIRLIKQADCLIVGGTSLSVYPAANLVTYFKGKHLVMINRDQTPYDYKADLVIHDSIGKVFGEIEKSL
ncbi:NAD-dependent deacetylase [Kandleria vitulina]|jgi:NAD-dependent deacetylase|uniref:NAD-dependent protein deacetylase n=2 Tax=Kandleria vitulina TaxID=1630 RepID=A0A0R2HAV8_9FIRM|nr:NAD-dependent protein deacylase [Kandleria vitulina]KRN49624.1 NAD-dependent deacetylase [Kandleria vitulina DSM 20405]MEE0987934.1 NAD-dependent protein deacylase [Kandleria vitulina]SDW26929.1 NAD-dependent deacetylase [Kandleria vitulina]SEJ02061.1 NAD-dependent deacetylase [Kandleria vitulina]HAD22563.1 NAD-dependent protein deacylase [Kandleria vitulina]